MIEKAGGLGKRRKAEHYILHHMPFALNHLPIVLLYFYEQNLFP